MHILLIHQIFNTPDEGGGTRHYELAKYLVKKGHKVTVVASNIDYLTGTKKNKTRDIKEGIEIIYSSSYQAVHKNIFFRALSFLSFSISSFVSALKVRNVDMVWGTSPPLFQAFTSFLCSKIIKKPFIFEVRDLWVDFAKELGIIENQLLIKLMKLFEKVLYRYSHLIVVNSPGFIPFIEKYVSKDKIKLVPNGVITKEFEIGNKTKLDFRIKHNLENKFIAIYLGNIGIANDIETIIEAADSLKEFKDIVFIIMGGGIKKDYFRNYVDSNELLNVLIADVQPKSEVPKILADVDICIATLKNISLFKTTYPNKVFDYMAAGKPTIITIDGVIREVIDSSDGGVYVEPGDSKGLSSAILKYYNSPELKVTHGKNARIYVKNNFERENIAHELDKIISSVH